MRNNTKPTAKQVQTNPDAVTDKVWELLPQSVEAYRGRKRNELTLWRLKIGAKESRLLDKMAQMIADATGLKMLQARSAAIRALICAELQRHGITR